MKNLKLYINKQLCDLQPSNLSYAITKQITDYNDISKRTGDFSYTIKIPLTKVNQKIFKFINNLDVINKFNKTKNYECSFYVNDNLMIEGYFNLTSIDEKYYNGYISNKISGIFNLFGDKTLQDITLPTIPFEGVMLPITSSPPSGNNYYQRGGINFPEVLNIDLCFDFQALLKGKKDPSFGLNLSTSVADYTDYYSIALVAYDNFYTDKTDIVIGKRAITNLLSYENFMPQVKFKKVLETLFHDIGFSVELQIPEYNDNNLVIPYFGNESPKWNYAHLASCSLTTDTNSYTDYSRFPGLRFLKNPLITSNFQYLPFNYINETWTNRKSLNYDWNSSFQYSDQTNLGLNTTFIPKSSLDSYVNSSSSTVQVIQFDPCMAVDKKSDYKVHYTMTNNLLFDFGNNFDYFSNPTIADYTPTTTRDSGWIYTVPATGKYSFDIQNFHDLRIYHGNKYGKIFPTPPPITSAYPPSNPLFPMRIESTDTSNYLTDKTKIALGNVVAGYENNNPSTGTWIYANREEFYIQNMVMVIKDNGDDLTNENSILMQSIKETFKPLVRQNLPYGQHDLLATYKKISQIKNDNIVAFYCPMLRDLYIGQDGVPKTWEEYVDYEKSILKNNQTYPLTEDDKLKYFGFGDGVDIKGFDNNITSTWMNITAKIASTTPPNYSSIITNYNATEQKKRKLVKTYLNNNYFENQSFRTFFEADAYQFYTREAVASGTVDWKFEANLTKGDQLRMVYITINQYGISLGLNNFDFTYPAFPTGTNYLENYFKNNPYQDCYTDEMLVNRFKINYISDEDKELKLSNFLPAIKQKDFIQDFIKSNNLYFDIKDNNITFKKQKDFISKNPQKDLTGNIDTNTISITPVENYKTIEYGFKASSNDDYKDLINNINPPLTIDNGNNIYLNNELLDLTSKIFSSSTNLDYRFYFFDIVYVNKFKQINSIKSQGIINITSFNEGGSSLTNLDEVDGSLDRDPRLIYHNDAKVLTGQTNGEVILINGLPFKYILNDIKTSQSNIDILLNSNRTDFFNNSFSNLQDSCYVELYVYLNETEFAKMDLSKPVSIDNTLYYIQKIDAYNPLSNSLTKILLLRL